MSQQTRETSIYAADLNIIGTIVWSNVNKANASDDQWAQVTLAKGEISHYLMVYGFGFDIPVGATINWVKVTIERHATNTLLYDYSIKLYVDGVPTGNDKASATGWPSSDTNADYGGIDTWGLSLTPSKINSEMFGIAISCKNYKTGSGASYIGYVDNVVITVDYTYVPGIQKTLTMQTQNVVSISMRKVLEKLFEYCNTGSTGGWAINSLTVAWSQTFTPLEDHSILYVKLLLLRVGNPGNIKVSLLYVNPSGFPCTYYPIQEIIFDANTLNTTYQWTTFEFTNLLPFASDVMLAIRIQGLDGDSNNYMVWAYRNTSGYPNGYSTTDNTKYESNDFMFEVWGFSGEATHWWLIKNIYVSHLIFKHTIVEDETGDFHTVYGFKDADYVYIGYAKSTDKGKTWIETIIASYPQNVSPYYINAKFGIVIYNGYLFVVGVLNYSTTKYKIVEFRKTISGGTWSGETTIASDINLVNTISLEVVYNTIVFTAYVSTTFYYTVFNGSSWSSFISFYVESNQVRYPYSLVGNNGEERLFYDRDITDNSPLREIDYIGSWGTPVSIIDTGTVLTKPFVLLINGVAHLFFIEKIGTHQHRIGYAKEVDGVWSEPIFASDYFYELTDDECYIRVLYRGEDGNFDVVFTGEKISNGIYSTYYYQFNGSQFSTLYQLFVGFLNVMDCFAEVQERYFTCTGYLNQHEISGYWIFNLKVSILFAGQIFYKSLYILMINLLHLAKCKPIKRMMSFIQFMRNSMR
jgi:hypothetical protein